MEHGFMRASQQVVVFKSHNYTVRSRNPSAIVEKHYDTFCFPMLNFFNQRSHHQQPLNQALWLSPRTGNVVHKRTSNTSELLFFS
jgi:hypothetical protein